MLLPSHRSRVPLSRRAFLRLTAGLTGWLLLGYGGYERGWLEVVRLPLRVPRLPAAFAGLTLAHLSDFHLGPLIPTSVLQAAIDQVVALQPDVVVVTGDFVTRSTRDEPTMLTRELRRLHPPFGTFACLGNWDWWTNTHAVTRALRQAGVTLLYNSHWPLQRASAVLYLAGVDSVVAGQPDLAQALHNIPPTAPVILLAHEPDFAEAAAQDARVGVQLSGHTHGGQVRFPFFGPLFLPRFGRKYPQGAWQVGGLQLYVNRGIGVTGVPLRFNCRPEVTLFTLE